MVAFGMQINPNETATFQRSGPRAAMHMLGALVFVMIGIQMGMEPERFSRPGAEVIGWACVVFFGSLFVLNIVRVMTGGLGSITLGPAGFHDPMNGPDTVPWHAIEKITFKKQRYVTLFMFEIEPTAFRNLTPPFPTRLFFAPRRALRSRRLGLSASEMTLRPRVLWYAITDYAKAHNPSVKIEGQP